MTVLIYLLIFISLSLLTAGAYGLMTNNRTIIKSRLTEISGMFIQQDDEAIFNEPLFKRFFVPYMKKVTGNIGKVAPDQIYLRIERTLKQAGSPANLTPNKMVIIMISSAFIIPLLVYYLLSLTPQNGSLLLVVLTIFLGAYIPYYVISIKARNRRKKIQLALPNMLDLIYVSVEAGLGFDMALKKTTEKLPGPLSDEFNKTLDEISKGKSRAEAFRTLASRTGVDDISSFISAILQSEQLGSNIANMLRVQSTVMRQKRRQRAEEMAMKIPIKMLFPLVFFMLPALFVVILGPAVIRIIKVISDLV